MTEGTHHLLDILGDTAATVDAAAPVAVERRMYRVINQDGLFKQGRHWPCGEQIELPVVTGARLVAAADVEAINEDEANDAAR